MIRMKFQAVREGIKVGAQCVRCGMWTRKLLPLDGVARAMASLGIRKVADDDQVAGLEIDGAYVCPNCIHEPETEDPDV